MPATSSISKTRALIPNCLSKDQHVFRTQLKKVGLSGSLEQQVKLDAIAEKVAKSIIQAEQRADSCPNINFPDLPISEKRAEIGRAHV